MFFRIVLLFFLFSSKLTYANQEVADLFDKVLQPHINKGFVAYGKINKDELNTLVDAIANHTIDKSNPDATLAFYLNAYNVLAVKGVVDGYGPHSLLSRYRFFKANDYVVAGIQMNLDTLEHKVIRPLNEPRIHFALVCAAISCPPLRSEAYRADLLEEQLNEQAIQFINDSEKNRFDLENQRSELSSIFKWFEVDFLLNANSLNEYVAQFVVDNSAKAALKENKLSVVFNDYDWSLNGKR